MLHFYNYLLSSQGIQCIRVRFIHAIQTNGRKRNTLNQVDCSSINKISIILKTSRHPIIRTLINVSKLTKTTMGVEQQKVSLATSHRILSHPFNFLLLSRQQQASNGFFTKVEKNMDKAGKALRR